MQRSIVIVGLGPGNYKHLSAEAIDELCSDKPLFLRTEIHPSVAFLKEIGIRFNSFDNLYREKDSFEDVYHEITEMSYQLLNNTPHLNPNTLNPNTLNPNTLTLDTLTLKTLNPNTLTLNLRNLNILNQIVIMIPIPNMILKKTNYKI